MRILVSGDSHADINHLKSMQAKVDKFHCDAIYVVGDFGFWPRDKDGMKFLKACEQITVPVYFTAGNHEDWEILDEHVKYPEYNPQGFINVQANIYYAPTGFTWEWDGVKFLSVGGAYSIDRAHRVKFIDWFPNEIITEEDVANCMGAGSVDLILSHDVPTCVDLTIPLIDIGKDFWLEENTEINRSRLQVIVDATEPKKLIHGHWHMAYRQQVGDLEVIGLNCNRTPDYFTVIDTEDWKS